MHVTRLNLCWEMSLQKPWWGQKGTPSDQTLLLLPLFVKLRQINLQYPSNAFNSPPRSLCRSDKLPNPSFLDLSPPSLRLTVMSLAGRPLPSRCVVGDGMITSQKVSLWRTNKDGGGGIDGSKEGREEKRWLQKNGKGRGCIPVKVRRLDRGYVKWRKNCSSRMTRPVVR